MPAFDADALVALVDAAHPHHVEAKHRFDSADQVLLHPSVVTEFTTVVRRHAKAKGIDGNVAAREALRNILTQPRVRLEERLAYPSAVARYMESKALSFTDAIVAQLAWQDQDPPVTFDTQLRRAATQPPPGK